MIGIFSEAEATTPMSGCAHKDPGEFCAACATEATLRGALHELSLIAADTMRGVTDCSTPLFQRVRNIVELLNAVEAERDAAGAALSAAMPPVPGVKDRTLADLVAQIIAERDELAEHERQTHERLGAILGTDTSLEDAARRMLRKRDEAQAIAGQHVRTAWRERDEALAAEAAVRRQLEGVEARYRDALTVLRAWSKWQPQTVAAWSQRHPPREAAALAATYERIRGDVEAQP